jgi:hypothetical protein
MACLYSSYKIFKSDASSREREREREKGVREREGGREREREIGTRHLVSLTWNMSR